MNIQPYSPVCDLDHKYTTNNEFLWSHSHKKVLLMLRLLSLRMNCEFESEKETEFCMVEGVRFYHEKDVIDRYMKENKNLSSKRFFFFKEQHTKRGVPLPYLTQLSSKRKDETSGEDFG